MKKYELLFSFFILLTSQLVKAQVADTIGAGYALQFNSNWGNYVDLGDAYNTLNFPFSFETWVDPTSYPGINTGYIFSSDNNASIYYGWDVLMYPNGSIAVRFGNGQGAGQQYRRGLETNNTLPLNAWTHIAVVFRSVSDVSIYFNGILQSIYADDGTSTSTTLSYNPGDHAWIGAGLDYYQFIYIGYLDEMRLWNDTLSQTTIRQNMCKKTYPKTPGLIGYWRADESINNTTVYDYSPNGVNGTITGTVPRSVSDAPVGNVSTYVYTGSWNGKSISLGSSTGDSLITNKISGQPDGVHIYGVNSKPYYTSGLKDTAKSYFGVFCVNGTSPAYTSTCHYSLTDGTINSSNQDSAVLDKRIDATDTPWTSLQGVTNISNQTVSKATQSSPQEYILDLDCVISISVIPQSPSVCSGQDVTLYATGGNTYIWGPSQSLNSITGDSVIASPIIQTTYTVIGKDSLGCSTIGTDVVYILPAPDKPTITQHDSILTTNATQGITWSRNDTILQGATDQNYTFTVAGWYKVVALNPANGCSATSDSIYFSPTGIDQISRSDNQLLIYPNPSSGVVNISASKNIDEIKVFNLLGQLMYTSLPKQIYYNFMLKDEGMYFVTIKIGDEITTSKLVVNK